MICVNRAGAAAETECGGGGAADHPPGQRRETDLPHRAGATRTCENSLVIVTRNSLVTMALGTAITSVWLRINWNNIAKSSHS